MQQDWDKEFNSQDNKRNNLSCMKHKVPLTCLIILLINVKPRQIGNYMHVRDFNDNNKIMLLICSTFNAEGLPLLNVPWSQWLCSHWKPNPLPLPFLWPFYPKNQTVKLLLWNGKNSTVHWSGNYSMCNQEFTQILTFFASLVCGAFVKHASKWGH